MVQAKFAGNKSFTAGTWGREFPAQLDLRDGDPAVLKCWARSGFTNSDPDAQLTRRWIEKIVLAGFLSNTWVEGAARFVMELLPRRVS